MKSTSFRFDLPTFLFGSFIAACALGLLAVAFEVMSGKIS
jgi:hypothetical protein